MKVFGDIGSKIVWGIIFLLIFGAGCVFVLRNFLSPPPATVPVSANTPVEPSATIPPTPTPSNSPVAATTTPAPSNSPTPSPSVVSSPTSPTASTPSPSLVPNNNNSPTPETNASSSPMPALALPDQVAMVVPKKVKPGAVLSIYEDVDNNERPDPIRYSPSFKKEVPGLSLINTSRTEFEEVSGYFSVPQTGNYSFVIPIPENYYVNLANLRLRIDGQPLPNVKGGNVTLERGWHKVDLFFFSYGSNITASQIQVKWGLEGNDLRLLQAWKEAA